MEFNKKGDFGLNKEEKFLLEMFSQIGERLKQQYNYSDEELYKIGHGQSSIAVPVSIFAGKLSPAEALAKFLKENHELSFKEISDLIGRDEGGIWANYRRAVKKIPWPLEITNGITVPVSIFNCEKSVLESIVSYLKNVKQLRNKKIAQLLNKNQANVWTALNRATKKENEKNN